MESSQHYQGTDRLENVIAKRTSSDDTVDGTRRYSYDGGANTAIIQSMMSFGIVLDRRWDAPYAIELRRVRASGRHCCTMCTGRSRHQKTQHRIPFFMISRHSKGIAWAPASRIAGQDYSWGCQSPAPLYSESRVCGIAKKGHPHNQQPQCLPVYPEGHPMWHEAIPAMSHQRTSG